MKKYLPFLLLLSACGKSDPTPSATSGGTSPASSTHTVSVLYLTRYDDQNFTLPNPVSKPTYSFDLASTPQLDWKLGPMEYLPDSQSPKPVTLKVGEYSDSQVLTFLISLPGKNPWKVSDYPSQFLASLQVQVDGKNQGIPLQAGQGLRDGVWDAATQTYQWKYTLKSEDVVK